MINIVGFLSQFPCLEFGRVCGLKSDPDAPDARAAVWENLGRREADLDEGYSLISSLRRRVCMSVVSVYVYVSKFRFCQKKHGFLISRTIFHEEFKNCGLKSLGQPLWDLMRKLT